MLSGLIWDMLAVVGAALVFAGLWWIYPPAGLIALGLAAVVFAFWVSRYWK